MQHITTSASFLEFGHINIDKDDPQKQIWDFRTGQKAYDWFMLARYMNDLYTYRKLIMLIEEEKLEEVSSLYKSEIHHKNDASLNLQKYLALTLFEKSKTPSFFELGQTLFGCIEGILFAQKILECFRIIDDEYVDLKNVDWFGVDISSLFNFVSKRLYADFKVHTFLPSQYQKRDTNVFFAKGVTLLYACKSLDDFITLLDSADIAVFDYSFSTLGDYSKTIGTGAVVHYCSLWRFLEHYKLSKKRMYIRAKMSKLNGDLLYIEAIYGLDALCLEFIKKDTGARERLANITDKHNVLKTLLNEDENGDAVWLELEKFLILSNIRQ